MPRANGSRPIATFVTVPAANHSDAATHGRPERTAHQGVGEHRGRPALSTATVQIPSSAPSTGNRAP